MKSPALPQHLSDPNVFSEGQEPYRAHGLPYPNLESYYLRSNPWKKSLNGQWKFHYVENPATRPLQAYQPEFDDQQWADIAVPGNIELQGFGYPIYVNDRYPFPKNPPYPPSDFNPVGTYRTHFTVPEAWKEKEV
ncbi:MAG: sugar-binding domain-containing protein, partial [Bacteroidota bacterium]